MMLKVKSDSLSSSAESVFSSEAEPEAELRPRHLQFSSFVCAGGDCLTCQGNCEKCKEHKANLARLRQLEETLQQLMKSAADDPQLTADDSKRIAIWCVSSLLKYAKGHFAPYELSSFRTLKGYIVDTFDLNLLPSPLVQQVHSMDLVQQVADVNSFFEIHDCSNVHVDFHSGPL